MSAPIRAQSSEPLNSTRPAVLALCLGTERIHGGDQSDMLQNTRVKVV